MLFRSAGAERGIRGTHHQAPTDPCLCLCTAGGAGPKLQRKKGISFGVSYCRGSLPRPLRHNSRGISTVYSVKRSNVEGLTFFCLTSQISNQAQFHLRSCSHLVVFSILPGHHRGHKIFFPEARLCGAKQTVVLRKSNHASSSTLPTRR